MMEVFFLVAPKSIIQIYQEQFISTVATTTKRLSENRKRGVMSIAEIQCSGSGIRRLFDPWIRDG